MLTEALLPENLVAQADDVGLVTASAAPGHCRPGGRPRSACVWAWAHGGSERRGGPVQPVDEPEAAVLARTGDQSRSKAHPKWLAGSLRRVPEYSTPVQPLCRLDGGDRDESEAVEPVLDEVAEG
jgi:hypothetical protein